MSNSKSRLFDEERQDEKKPLVINTSTPDDEKKPVDTTPAASAGQLLFRYASNFDVFLFLLGTAAAICNGAALPTVFLVFGDMIQNFVNFEVVYEGYVNGTVSETFYVAQKDLFMTNALDFFMYYLAIGVVSFVCGYLQFSSWMWLGERITRRVRLDYFLSIMSQEIGWFDEQQTGNLTTRMVNDTQEIQEGISEKTSQSLQQVAAFLAGFVIAFTKGPILTLVLLSVFPVLAVGGAFIAKFMQSLATKGQAAYAEAGAVAEEIFSSVRTVVAFGGEKRATKEYTKKLDISYNAGIGKGRVTGLGLGFVMLVLFCSYALAFWYGGKLVVKGTMDPGNVLTVFFTVIIGAFALGQATPGITSFLSAKSAAGRVFSVVDRVSKVDPFGRDGDRPNFKGDIEFKNVTFNYPTRPDIPILRGLNVAVSEGKTLALVGASGCGKSTVVSILEKFYSIDGGSVAIDGHRIESINTKWLRSHLGLVSQEPTLFAMSIRDNIALGKMEIGQVPSQSEIEEAAKAANAHKFIVQLPKGYDTLVGERGAQLSGGQKQRVAIARALIKKPKILLLDEATSALDSHSERKVQAALDNASKGRTTIVIAHRLSTIQNADKIAVIKDGVVAEEGDHSSLIARNGIYTQMVSNQALVTIEKEHKAEKEVDLKSSASLLKSSATNANASTETPEGKEEEYPVSMGRVFNYNKKETLYLVGGVLAACANGAVMPAFAKIFSKITSIFALVATDIEEFKQQSLLWSMMFVSLGVGCFFANVFQAMFFSIASERLTRRLRKKTFITMLKQPIGWFDLQTTGKLTTKLANDAALVNAILGSRLATIVQALVSMVAGLALAFLGGWEMTLVILGCVPFIAMAGAFQMKTLQGFSQQTRLAYESAGTISTQAIENARTVASLAKERKFWEDYHLALETPFAVGVKRAQLSGIGFGCSQFFIFLTYGIGFYFGAYLMSIGKMNFLDVMQVFSAVVFSAMAASQASALAPDYSKAKDAAGSIFRILDTVSEIDATRSAGEKIRDPRGEVKVERVGFSYPTRPTVKVATDLNLHLAAGKTIALVGPSGCGKSTIVSLILRFYDPTEGRLLLDEIDLRALNVRHLRQQAGIVSQEPILFAQSIKDNIAYGKPGNVKMEEIEAAAKKANIHNFITSLPDGYNTYVGEKGTQLSGGQKQRIAIARALIRNPKILLLDEATSALDTESEKVVQEALDAASVDRTTILIAHRLSTVQNAHLIAVVDEGKIVERGTHAELIEKGGLYSDLVRQQQRV